MCIFLFEERFAIKLGLLRKFGAQHILLLSQTWLNASSSCRLPNILKTKLRTKHTSASGGLNKFTLEELLRKIIINFRTITVIIEHSLLFLDLNRYLSPSHSKLLTVQKKL